MPNLRKLDQEKYSFVTKKRLYYLWQNVDPHIKPKMKQPRTMPQEISHQARC